MYIPTESQPSCARAWIAAAMAIEHERDGYNVVIDIENPVAFDERDNALPLPAKPLSGYRSWDIGLGTGRGVTSLKAAQHLKVTSETSDAKVATSVIHFQTDATNDVLVIITGGNNKYPDPARKGREGHKAVLNAFEIKQIK